MFYSMLKNYYSKEFKGRKINESNKNTDLCWNANAFNNDF